MAFIDETTGGAAGDEPAVRLNSTAQGLATVVLNRPTKKNAFGPDLILGLSDAFDTLRGADHVRMVVLRGAGGSFCAGADLNWMAETADWMEDDNREDALRLAGMLKKLSELPQLTVALVEGPAFGGGAGLVAACDHAVAVRAAVFAFSEVKLGLVPATISPHVVRAIGSRRAKMLFVTGRRFGAEDALRFGLVHEVVDDASGFEPIVAALAADVRSSGPQAAALSKALVDQVLARPLDHALLEHTARAIAERRSSAEGREGVAAFLERRRPEWCE